MQTKKDKLVQSELENINEKDHQTEINKIKETLDDIVKTTTTESNFYEEDTAKYRGFTRAKKKNKKSKFAQWHIREVIRSQDFSFINFLEYY